MFHHFLSTTLDHCKMVSKLAAWYYSWKLTTNIELGLWSVPSTLWLGCGTSAVDGIPWPFHHPKVMQDISDVRKLLPFDYLADAHQCLPDWQQKGLSPLCEFRFLTLINFRAACAVMHDYIHSKTINYKRQQYNQCTIQVWLQNIQWVLRNNIF